jgi:signal transduction histidine kinase
LAAHCESDVVGARRIELSHRLAEARALNEGVEYLLVEDGARRVLAHTLPAPPSEELLRANRLDAGTEPRVVVIETAAGRIHDAVAPILGGRGGSLRVGMGEGRIAKDVRWLTRQVTAATLVVAVLGLGAAWGLTRILAHPIHDLVAVAHRVRGGALDADVRVHAKDEIGELAFAFNEMIAALRDKERQRQDLLRKVLAVGEDERKRLARELHDQTGQDLTSLIAGLGALEASAGAAPVSELLARLRELAERTLGGVQDVSRALRPSALDDLGLDAALRRQCDTMGRRFGATVELQSIGWDDAPRVSPEVEIALYRIVQESLTNAARHGRARSVQVLLQRMTSRVLIVVEDDGVGFDASDWRGLCRARGHLGLLGVEERASLLGGSLRVESSPGSGTSVFVEIPLRAGP